MRISRLIVSAAAGAALTLASGAQGAEGPIASIETEYLGRLKVATDLAQTIVPRIVYPVTNCSFQGPKIKATCVARHCDSDAPLVRERDQDALRLDFRQIDHVVGIDRNSLAVFVGKDGVSRHGALLLPVSIPRGASAARAKSIP